MTIVIFFIKITIMMILEGATMVDEGEVREGKSGGLVVCYRGAWLPQVIITVSVNIIVIVIVASVQDDCPFAQHRAAPTKDIMIAIVIMMMRRLV